jgi:hypothetical protein
MLASDLAPNSFEVGSEKRVEGTYGWPHDMRRQLTPSLSNELCGASNPNFSCCVE